MVFFQEANAIEKRDLLGVKCLFNLLRKFLVGCCPGGLAAARNQQSQVLAVPPALQMLLGLDSLVAAK